MLMLRWNVQVSAEFEFESHVFFFKNFLTLYFFIAADSSTTTSYHQALNLTFQFCQEHHTDKVSQLEMIYWFGFYLKYTQKKAEKAEKSSVFLQNHFSVDKIKWRLTPQRLSCMIKNKRGAEFNIEYIQITQYNTQHTHAKSPYM